MRKNPHSGSVSLAAKCILVTVAGLLLSLACNRSIEIEKQAPSITLSASEYFCEEGETLFVVPVAEFAQGAVIGWWLGAEQVATTLQLEYRFTTKGTYYLTLKVTTEAGTAQAVIKVTVTAKEIEPPTPPDTIVVEPPIAPIIHLADSYTVKTADTLLLTPEVEYAQDAVFVWELGADTLATTCNLAHVFSTPGSYTLLFSAQTAAGRAQQEVRVQVLERTPPVITLNVASGSTVTIPKGQVYSFTATVKYDSLDTFAWYLDGNKVSTSLSYNFEAREEGAFTLSAVATNDDGVACEEVNIVVKTVEPIDLQFITVSYNEDLTQIDLFDGQYLYLLPVVSDATSVSYNWMFNGKQVSTQPVLFYAPKGSGTLVLTVTDTQDSWHRTDTTLTVTLHGSETAGMRSKTAQSSASANKVYEYLPAPGQFINEEKSGFTGENTPEQAQEYAQNRLTAEKYVSLGAFGGHIIVGFDHSIKDFSIACNAILRSSEPGVVWVMQDTNADGLPNDQWYELKGSEYGNKSVYTACQVTYYKPSQSGAPVKWTDNYGRSGEIPYMASFHPQSSYYPQWVQADSYTLQGTWLPSNNVQDPTTGEWNNQAWSWGYADNYGNDYNSATHRNHFKIANAIYPNGEPAKLSYIDFIKVQTGTQAVSGILGEQSTEVMGFYED